MAQGYRLIDLERLGNTAFVRLVRNRLDENEVYQLFGDLLHLARADGAIRIALCLGPKTPDCLYSVFLAKLIGLQLRLREMGGALKLCECTPQVIDILNATLLLELFDIVPDRSTVLEQWDS